MTITRKAALILIFSLLFLAGCGKEEFVRSSEILISDKTQAVEKAEIRKNPCSALDIPTQVNKIGDTWFIVDCYHDQIIYNDNMEDPLTEWNVMTDEMSRGHTVAGMAWSIWWMIRRTTASWSLRRSMISFSLHSSFPAWAPGPTM